MKIKLAKSELIHFVGIGGIGMSGLALIMKDLGFKVQGSDISNNKNIERLKKKKIKIFIGHKTRNINKSTILVISSAIKSNNSELKFAKKRKIPIYKRGEMLANVVSLMKNVVVAGSHGKTTTTSLISNIFSYAKIDPTVINGGVLNSFSGSAKLGKSDWCILESDESDGSFLNLPINYSVVTNIDKEHIDFYKNFNNLKNSFIKFLNKTPASGKAFVCIDDYQLKKIIPKINKKNFFTYGFSTRANFQIFNAIYKKNYSIFDLRISLPGVKKITIKKIKLNLIGSHNVLNSAASIALCLHIGISINVIKTSLKKFSGIQRRLTKVFKINGREFFDDYAHHPTEIQSVLKSIKITSDKKRRIIAVFQPHRYSRLKLLKNEFASSFKHSDLVILSPVYSAGEKIDKQYDEMNFAKLISRNSKVQVIMIKNEIDLRKFFIKNLLSNEIVICLGAGSISKWIREMNL